MKRLALKPDATSHARDLRRDATPPERALWRGLRTTFPHAHFRRQVPFGPYFADFASHAYKLIIELDGGSHAHTQSYDAARTRFLEGEGYRLIRVWNNEVVHDLNGVLARVEPCLALLPASPTRGEEVSSNLLFGV